MTNSAITLLFLLLAGFGLNAQTARVQIIHNSPDPVVDVYAGPSLLLDDFSFRTATGFVDVPAGIPIPIGIAPSTSTSFLDAIFTQTLTLESGKTYVVTASGIVGNALTPFGLNINDEGREEATNAAKIDVAILHGSTDAPAVDIAVRTGGILVADLTYGEFTGYTALDPGVYYLDVKPAGSNTIVQTFKADLSGLAGGSAYVFASGLLTPGAGPAFGIFAALADGTVVEFPATPVARVQVIHNSPDPTVDVWANNDLLIDNFTFRTATPFIFVPAGVNIDLAVAPASSASPAEALATFPVILENGKTYIVTANGIVGDPSTPFTLNVNAEGREAAVSASKVDIAVLHGSPNAPAVDIDEVLTGNIITDLTYGEFTPYLSLDPGIYDLAVRVGGTPTVVATFRADLSGLSGAAAYVFASGLVGNGTTPFGVYAALPNGDVIALPLTPTSRLQVIHNSPDPTVDVYAGNVRLIDDFAFLTATPFVDVPAGRVINVGIAPANSAGASESIAFFPVTLDAAKKYTVIAGGVVGNTQTPFNLYAYDNALESAPIGSVSISVFHGSPDAPAVDVAERLAGTLVGNLSFGENTEYLTIPASEYILDIKPAGQDVIVQTYRADLSPLSGQAARIIAGGYLGGIPAFGIYAVLADGTVLALPTTRVARAQIIHNSPTPTVDIYVNGQQALNDFAFRTATPFGYILADEEISVAVAPANSQSVNDAIATFPVTFENGGTYVVMASGIVGNAATPFTLSVNAEARELATTSNNVAVTVFHGSTDAPEVDITLPSGTPLIDNLAYGQFSDYAEVAAQEYQLNITPASDNNTIVASYTADLSTLGNQAIVAFASGFLAPSAGDPTFGVWVALSDGTTFALPQYVAVNELTQKISALNLSPNPATDVLTAAFRLEGGQEVLRYRINDMTGRLAQEGDWGAVQTGAFSQTINTSELTPGMYLLEMVSDNGRYVARFSVQR